MDTVCITMLKDQLLCPELIGEFEDILRLGDEKCHGAFGGKRAEGVGFC